MCGIAGFIDLGGRAGERLLACVTAMASTLAHRGPDDAGTWVDEERGVALGFRRLSIIDLSEQGRQPMVSASGRYVTVYNGEIYNFIELRKELERSTSVVFRGHSDTEVMLAVIEQVGVQRALERFNGMFALAVWDRQQRTLHLARDRFGEKPLYYGWLGRSFAFASELKALRAHEHFCGQIDRDALALYLRYGYVPTPYSIFNEIRKLPPGTVLTMDFGRDERPEPEPMPYWSALDVARRSVAEPFAGSAHEAADALEAVLWEAVKSRMVADVPLGAFLSGGIDSSTIVALMQRQSPVSVKTFSIGFAEARYNEAEQARVVARHLGTDHTDLYVSPEEARGVIPRLPCLYDEPFADSSQIPTFLLCGLARREVTVSLSGDGGDELFGGYDRYRWTRRVWQGMGWFPSPLRTLTAGVMGSASPALWNNLLDRVPLVPGSLRHGDPGQKLHRLAEALRQSGAHTMYRALMSNWQDPALAVTHGAEPTAGLGSSGRWPDFPDVVQRMMYADTVTYLSDDILAKVDRASMGVSLETRMPLLDPRVFEFAWRLPLSMKVRDGKGKWLLRQVLHRHVPKRLVGGPKRGFGVPVALWLRGPLREWAEELLSETRLRSDGYLDPLLVRAYWQQHLVRKHNREGELWSVLMFQAWLESWRQTASPTAVAA